MVLQQCEATLWNKPWGKKTPSSSLPFATKSRCTNLKYRMGTFSNLGRTCFSGTCFIIQGTRYSCALASELLGSALYGISKSNLSMISTRMSALASGLQSLSAVLRSNLPSARLLVSVLFRKLVGFITRLQQIRLYGTVYSFLDHTRKAM